MSAVAFVGIMTAAVLVVAVMMSLAMGAHDRAGGAVVTPASPAVAVAAAERHVEASVPPPPKTRAERAKEARALAALAGRASAVQKKSDAAVAEVLACGDLPGAADRLRATADARSTVISRLSTLELRRLPGGRAAADTLSSAQSTARRADQAYLQWALAAGWSCVNNAVPETDASYARAVAASAQAQTIEQRFAKRFDALG